MSNYKTNGTFDATQTALEYVYNYYGTDTTDSYYYHNYLDTADPEYFNKYEYDDTPDYSHYSRDYDADWEGLGAAFIAVLGAMISFFLVIFALAIVTAIARWSVFKKAKVDGWEALIPVHSEVVELKLSGIKTYWYFLNLVVIPFAIGPLIFAFWKNIKLAHSFGKGTGFGVGLTLLPVVFYPILAWGSAQYIGPQTNSNESIFYDKTNNAPQPTAPITQPIVTDTTPYIDPNANMPKPEIKENPIMEEKPIIEEKTEVEEKPKAEKKSESKESEEDPIKSKDDKTE